MRIASTLIASMGTIILLVTLARASTSLGDYKTRWITGLAVPTFDNLTLGADVFVPIPEQPNETFPVIIFPNSWGCPEIEYLPRAAKFAEHRFVAIEYLTRGWKGSGGVIDTAGPLDRADGSSVIDFVVANAAAWNANVAKIAFVGISYGAGIGLEMAAHDSRVTTAVAMSGWNNLTDMFYGGETPNYSAGKSLIDHAKKSGHVSPEMVEVFADLKTHTNMSFVRAFGFKRSPQRSVEIYAQRQVPLFMSSNYMDRLFRPQYMALDFFNALQTPKFLLLNQGSHAEPEGVGIFVSNNYIWNKVNKWLDHYLHGENNGIDSEPIVHMQLGPSIIDQTYLTFNSTTTTSSPTTLFFGQRQSRGPYGSLATQPTAPYYDKIAFSTSPGLTSAKADDRSESLGFPFVANFSAAPQSTSIVYQSDPMPATVTLCGTPKLSLAVSATEYNFQVYAFLYDVDGDVSQNQGTLLSEGYYTNWAPHASKTATMHLHTICRTVNVGHRVAVGLVLSNELYIPASTTVEVVVEYGERSFIELPLF